MTRVLEESSDSADGLSGHAYIKKFAKQMLKNSLFIGTFKEKRFVESLNSYRDVVHVASGEDDFITNLLAVKKKINEGFIKRPWLGITEPDTIGAPVGYNLWVELKEEVFGKYWYKVRTVEFLENEIKLKLEIIRPVKQEHTPLLSMSSSKDANSNQNAEAFNLKVLLNEISLNLKLHLIYFYRTILTFENMKKTVIFIFLLIGTIVAGGASVIQYLMEYLLQLIRELSGLIKAVTPIVISFVNIIGKSVFGFYHLIVALYRGKPTPQPVYNSYVTFDPQMFHDPQQRYNQYFPKEFPYYPTRGSRPRLTITPLDH